MERSVILPTINLLDIKLTKCDQSHLLTTLAGWIEVGKKALVLSGNVHSFNLAYERRWLRDLFCQADVVRVDGFGLRLGARLSGHSLPPRMTWADFVWDLAAMCAKRHFSLFFLGARPGIARKAAQRLQSEYPDLRFAGIHHGYFDKTRGCPENTAVIQAINKVKPDILIVGFGMPLQEKWLSQNWNDLNATITMTGGAVFDYVSGELQRAPRWMTDNGLEWLGRLLIEPGRLWRRYLIGNPLFLWRVLRQRWGRLPFP